MQVLDKPEPQTDAVEVFIEMLYRTHFCKPKTVDHIAYHLRLAQKRRKEMGIEAEREWQEDKRRQGLRRQDQVDLEGQLYDAGFPIMWQGANFETDERGDALEIDTDNERGIKLMRRLCDEWTPNHKGLVLEGPAGCGKTYALKALGVGLVKKHRHGISLKFCAEKEFLGQIFQSFRRDKYDMSASTTQVREWVVKRPHVLLLDDLGAKDVERKEWAIAEMLDLFDYRWGHELTTVVTTNLTRDQLAAMYGERIVSRLYARSPLIHMSGPDRRQRVLPDSDDPFAEE